MLLTTTNTIEGKEITQYFGIVLREAKETSLKEMSDHATQLGANAVIAIDLDYETVGGSGSMLMVTAAGTAVRYQ